MSKKVEQVARAICRRYSEDTHIGLVAGTWEAVSQKDGPYDFAEAYRELARAAIEAMREPTWKMTRVGMKHATADHIFSAMIDEALK